MSKRRQILLKKAIAEFRTVFGLEKGTVIAYSGLPFRQRLKLFSKRVVQKGLREQAPAPPVSLSPRSLTYSPRFQNLDIDGFWQALNPVIDEQRRRCPRAQQPSISIITPTYNSSLDWFIETVISVLTQTACNWEWCIVDDGSTKTPIRDVLSELAQKHPNIKVAFQESSGISGATNKAVDLATADYVCFLDHDDALAPHAIAVNIEKINQGFDVIYSDEDKIDYSGRTYVEPFFKPDWSPEYLRGVMYVGHLLCVRKKLIETVGGFDSQYDGVQDYELMLRLSEMQPTVVHISDVLYHWRKIEGSISADIAAKPKIDELQELAVTAHLRRLGLAATATRLGNHRIRVSPQPREHSPLVSIIIPTKNAPHHLARCLDSMFSISSYPNMEVILVDNDTDDVQALDLIKRYPVKRVFLPNPFNYSRANNLGNQYATGDYLIFLNNDTEVVAQDWIQHLIYYAEQPDVGAVGALLLYPDRTVQHAGVVTGFRGTADHVMRGFPANVDGYAGSLACAREVTAVTAACLMLSKRTFEQIGGFNEHYFHHYQDVDLCLKLRALGKRNIYVPGAKLIHHESATRKSYYDFPDRYLLLDQWQEDIDAGDPYYNSSFTLERFDYSLRAD